MMSAGSFTDAGPTSRIILPAGASVTRTTAVSTFTLSSLATTASTGKRIDLAACLGGLALNVFDCRHRSQLVKRFPHSAALCEQEGVHHPADDEEIHLFGEMPSTSIFLETLGPPTIAATGRCGASRANFVHRSARRMRAESRGADAAVPDFGPDAKKARRTSTTWRPGSGLAW